MQLDVLHSQRNFFNSRTEITDQKTGEVVAQTQKQRSFSTGLVADHGDYTVKLVPGLDTALVVAIIICLDETM